MAEQDNERKPECQPKEKPRPKPEPPKPVIITREGKEYHKKEQR